MGRGAHPFIAVPELLRWRKVQRTRELEAAGIRHDALGGGLTGSVVRRIGHGVYAPRNVEVSPFAVAACRVPRGIVCLFSALELHGLDSEPWDQVFMALPHKAWRPRAGPGIAYASMGQAELDYEVAELLIDGIEVRLFGVAKSIADCFVRRRRLGPDCVVAAMRLALEKRACSPEQLLEAARVCQVLGPVERELRRLRAGLR